LILYFEKNLNAFKSYLCYEHLLTTFFPLTYNVKFIHRIFLKKNTPAVLFYALYNCKKVITMVLNKQI